MNFARVAINRLMRRSLKWTALVPAAAIGISLSLSGRPAYSGWDIRQEKPGIAWAPFEWTSGYLDGKYFERTSMNIPCRIEGVANPVTFQFDLGADLTGVYENTFTSLAGAGKLRRLKSPLKFWNKRACFENMTLRFGDYTAVNPKAFVYRAYGGQVTNTGAGDTIHIGSVGSDMFRGKVLIIDYPNRRFAICEQVPAGYGDHLVDMELDRQGRPVLPMQLRGRSYRIMFDNGSSIFPIIAPAKNISKFSTSPDTDTIMVSSWGKLHGVTGKLIGDTFALGGQQFCQVKVYANHSGYGIDPATDGLAGNALFWDRTIVIDFKNRKFGVR